MQQKTPILLIIFNRPDKVRTLVDTLRTVRPTKLFIAADGPRLDAPTDIERCRLAREAISEIDWPCEIQTRFDDKNTGADHGPEKAINWFFEHVEEGVVLEDDCNPHPDFFPFVDTMLERYRNNPHIMMISGNNFQNGLVRGDASYYFSKYPSTWGWATWKRAWEMYDTDTKKYDTFVQNNTLKKICTSKAEERYWGKFFRKIHSDELEHWDIKWIFALWSNGGISITPNINLVQNIGFGPDATHTLEHDDKMVVQAKSLTNIVHPGKIEVNKDADTYLFEHIYRFTFKKKVQHLFRIIRKRIGM